MVILISVDRAWETSQALKMGSKAKRLHTGWKHILDFTGKVLSTLPCYGSVHMLKIPWVQKAD